MTSRITLVKLPSMPYPEGKMDQTPEQPPTEQEVSWEVVDPQDLPVLLEYTLEQTVVHQLTRISGIAELLTSELPHHLSERGNLLNDLNEAHLTASLQVDTVRQILRHPDQPLPVDRTTYPKPIINLDLVKPPSPQQPPPTT